MCDPVSAIMGVGMAAGAAGSFMDGQAQAGVANYNATVSRAQAEDTKTSASLDAQSSRARMQRLVSQQTGALAARGVSLNSSGAQTLAGIAGEEIGTEETSIIQTGQSQATSLSAEADLQEHQGRLARFRGYTNAASSTLNGGMRLWPGLSAGLSGSGGGAAT
ncbi:MAG: hypothetical protein AAFU34_15550 [Pseudomonadota bacterium]